jgi:ribosomal protein S30
MYDSVMWANVAVRWLEILLAWVLGDVLLTVYCRRKPKHEKWFLVTVAGKCSKHTPSIPTKNHFRNFVTPSIPTEKSFQKFCDRLTTR